MNEEEVSIDALKTLVEGLRTGLKDAAPPSKASQDVSYLGTLYSSSYPRLVKPNRTGQLFNLEDPNGDSKGVMRNYEFVGKLPPDLIELAKKDPKRVADVCQQYYETMLNMLRGFHPKDGGGDWKGNFDDY